jgi:hypothetical protein
MTSARSRAGGGAGGGGHAGPSSMLGNQGGSYMRYSSPPPSVGGSMGNSSRSTPAGFQTFAGSPYEAPSGHMGAGGGAGNHAPAANQAGGFGGFANFTGFQGSGSGGDGVQTMFNDHTAQMGMHIGRQMAQAGGEYVEKNFNRYLPVPVLKHYFNVSNSYVLHKLRLVLFPWRHKPWSRAHRHSGGRSTGGVTPGGNTPAVPAYPGMSEADGNMNGVSKLSEGFAPPREDVNSPDLYIPAMSVVTYVLLVAVIRGLESRFHPEALGVSLSKALGIMFFEFILVKLGCYLLNIQGEHTVVDLFAYSGYKFLGVIITLLVGLMRLGRMAYWGVWAYTTAAIAFFLLRSLRYVVLPDPSSPSSVTITHAQRSRRIQFLFSIAVAQSFFGWLLIIGIWN